MFRIFVGLFLTLFPAIVFGGTIWIEGEKPAESHVTRHPWWYDKVKTDQLSGGDWISNFTKDGKPGEVSYRFTAPAAGKYHLFFRINPVRGGYTYRLSDGDWQTLNLGAAFDQINIAADDKPDLRFIAWVDAGKVELSAGVATLDIRIDGKIDHHGAIDAIVFTDDMNWQPHGKLKPGEAAPAPVAPEGGWIWAPTRDNFTDDALLDLSYLNEKTAGEHGFIRVDTNGDFVNDAGPIRFWAIGDTVYRRGMDALKENARFLAKHGVNMVRWHGNLAPQSGDINQPDEHALDELFQFVAAMKQQGIYITVSPYYAHATHVNGKNQQRRRDWGLPRDAAASNTGSLLFFDPKLQNAYKNWVKVMMTRTNPYTGIALRDDPVVAIFQIQNEDSLLFWTINGLKGADREILRKQFGQWLANKYGSLAAACAAWNGVEANGAQSPSDWNTGSIAISNAWAWAQPNLNRGDLGKRMSDEVQFLVTTMRRWNAEVEHLLHDQLGAPQVINAGNWKTADPLRLNDLERYSYAGQGVIGVNRYTTAMHKGPNAGWAVVKGDRFANISVALHPRDLPVGVKQIAGKAFILPEANWVPPNLYQSEAATLVAAYMSLNGVDGYYWFNTGQVQWRQPQSANGYLDSIGKWVIATPEIIGNFPAAALMYRKGYLERGKPAVVEHRTLDDLWQRRPPVISEEGTFDPNRDAGDISDHSPVKTQIDPLAFLVGPVEVVYDSDPRKTTTLDLSKYIDTQKQIVTSDTGQLRCDYGRGIVTFDSPKAQGADGFLNKLDRIQLRDVTITSRNDYGSVAIVSLDDQPIRNSEKLLVQVGTTARPTGWKQRPLDGGDFQIVEHGKAPWVLGNIDAALAVRNAKLREAVVLDANGYPVRTIALQQSAGVASLTLPVDAKYIVLR